MNKRQMLLGGAAAVALGAGLILPPQQALAQAGPGTQVTVSGYVANSFSVSTTSGNCTTSNTSSTLTITPPAGNYVYLTGFYVEGGLANSTGSLTAVAYSSSNLNGSPAWLLSFPAPAATANVAASQQMVAETYSTPFKSTTPGTAVALTPTAAVNSAYVCAKATGYFAPF